MEKLTKKQYNEMDKSNVGENFSYGGTTATELGEIVHAKK